MAARSKSSDAVAQLSRAGRALRVFLLTFKWCRITVLLLVLISVVLGLFLHKVGFPVAFQQRIVDRARAEGWDLEFSRLRLRWYYGFVAEDLALSRTNAVDGPHLFVRSAQLKPRFKSLLHLRLDLESARLAGGRLVWPMPDTNSPTHTLVMENIRGELLFKPGDTWELRSLDAAVLGANVHVRGELLNASYLREWKFARKPDRIAKGGPAIWNRFLGQYRKLRFQTAPDVSVVLSGDARDPRSLATTLKAFVPSFESPWAKGTDARFTAAIQPPGSNDYLRAEIKATVLEARTPWGSGTNLELNLTLDPSLTHLVPTNAALLLEVQAARTIWGSAEQMVLNAHCEPDSTNRAARRTRFDLSARNAAGDWGKATSVQLAGRLSHSSTNLLPGVAETDVKLVAPHTRWATSEWARLQIHAMLPEANRLGLLATNTQPWPDRLSNITFRSIATVSNLHAWRLAADTVRLTNRWEPPQLAAQFETTAPGATIHGSASLDAPSHSLTFSTDGALELHRFLPLLDTNLQRWLTPLRADQPARWHAIGSLVLPAWTNREPDWQNEVMPTLSLSGQIEAGKGEYSGVAYNSADTLFTFSNLMLHAPEVRITRPEGTLELDFSADHRTGAFRCGVRSSINPRSLDPLFRREDQTDTLDLLRFDEPPRVSGIIVGNTRDWRQIAFEGDVAVTNAAIRDQLVKACTAHVHLTNNFITILNPLVLREGERGVADGIGLRLGKPRLYLTNATGNLAPFAIAKAIGPETYRDVAPYVFDVPPMGRVNGSVPLGKSDHTEDMLFEVNGGPFHWRQLHFDQIQGAVHWRGSNVTLTNVQGRWCGGPIKGWLFLDTSPTNTDLLSFRADYQNTSLHAVASQLKPSRTNHLEGLLSGELNITRADLKDDLSWQGFGSVHLTNGLIWDIPVFGAFSPVLNAFIPGLGNSRAKHAAATFGITNSVIHSRDLDIRATMMRMQFRGTIGFDDRVDGRMEAELLRDMPAVGFVISKVFWPVTKLFEYKVTGTLNDPKTEQLYVISKVLLFPFQPIKTMRDLFKEPEGKEGTQPAPPPTVPDKPTMP